MASLVCPICRRELGKSERLEVSLDNVGSLLVRHSVHKSVPYRGSVPDDEWYRLIKEAPLEYGENVHRHICGRAGFKSLDINGTRQGSATPHAA